MQRTNNPGILSLSTASYNHSVVTSVKLSTYKGRAFSIFDPAV